jgi:hypothetical protein
MPPFDEITSRPHVCRNCFRRTHDRIEANYRLTTYHGDLVVEPVDDRDDQVTRRPHETSKIPEKGAIRGLRTVCECGFRPYEWAWIHEQRQRDDIDDAFNPEWKERPLDIGTFFEYLEHLIDRLDELGVTYDEDELWARAEELKRDPDEQFAADRIYERAINAASTKATVNRSTRAAPAAD